MSRIFDALQTSDAEHSGLDVRDLEALKLLQDTQRDRSDGRESPLESADFPVRTTRSSCQMGPEAVLQPLPEESEGESAKLPLCELETDDKQRDELMKFIQQVFLMPGAQAPRTVVLAGTEPENGCSWIICRVADMLASHLKRPICIVDANLRSPGLHQMFGVQNHHGLSEALEAEEPIHRFVRPLGRQNLWLLSSGAATDCRSLLSPYHMRLRLSELLQYFKYVLIDSPDLSRGKESIVLGGIAEGVVLVLKANSSRQQAARKAVQDLQHAGVRILGAVLNRRTFPIPQAIYDKL